MLSLQVKIASNDEGRAIFDFIQVDSVIHTEVIILLHNADVGIRRIYKNIGFHNGK